MLFTGLQVMDRRKVRAPMHFLDEILSSPNQPDNYDEVEMELDSDNEKENSIGTFLKTNIIY